MPNAQLGFDVRRGIVSWDTLQDVTSSPLVRAFVSPRPNAKSPPDYLQAGRLRWITKQNIEVKRDIIYKILNKKIC